MKHAVMEHRSDSGAGGLVINVPGSAVASLQLRFNSGFQFADPAHYEVPHVMEHLLATVTAKHAAPNEFIVTAQKNGAYVNASTSVEANGYLYECADFELERIVDLMEEQVTQPLFAPESLRAELGNVREELTRNTTQHGTVCSIGLAAQAFPHLWMTYEERLAQLDSITLDQVEQHYRKTHTAANARFYVAGDFPDGGLAMAARFDRMLAQLPRGQRLVRNGDMGRDVARPLVAWREIGQLYYRVSMYFGELTAAERRALTMLRMVLTGGMGARVLGAARRRGLAYSVAGTGHAEVGNSSFGFGGYVTPEHARPLFELMTHEFAAVRDGGVTKTELQAAKDLVVGSVKRSTQTVGDVMGWYIEPYDETGEIRDFDHELELLRAVTPEQVSAVATKAAEAGRRGLSLLGPVSDAEAQVYGEILAPLWR